MHSVSALGGILGWLAAASCANPGAPAQSFGDDGGLAEASFDAPAGSSCDANVQSDPRNCGRCGVVCSSGQVCSSGACMSECPAQQTQCPDWGCVDTTTDIHNCGTCGNTCTAPPGGIPVPDAGTTDSGADGASGADASPDAAADAGADASGGPIDDGQRIATAACVMSSCTFTCPQGTNIQKCSDGCWDVSVSPTHCGFCGVQCSAGQTCQSGVCCGAPSQVCGGVCVDVTQDPTNCGSCGHKCSMGVQCSNGACVGYTPTTPMPTLPWIDACTLPGHKTVLANETTWFESAADTLPFPFTFYGVPETQFWVGSQGAMGFGVPPAAASGPPDGFGTTCLPDSVNNFAAIEPFGDSSLYTTASGVCYGATGASPNNQLVVTWEKATESLDSGSVLTFSVILTQNTNTIDFVYNTATAGAAGNTQYVHGGSAVVGLQQDQTKGTAATASHCPGPTEAFSSVPFSIRYTPQQ